MQAQSGRTLTLLLGLVVAIAVAYYGGFWLAGQDGGSPTTAGGINKPALFNNDNQPPHTWPPLLDAPFPNLTLVSHTGETVSMRDFLGKVVLVEPIGMTCAACNAFSGANDIGGYAHINPQQNLPSIEKLLPRYGDGAELDDADIVLVQVIFYDMKLKAPSADDAREWAEHFGFDENNNVYVLAGDERYINRASYNMIPGFFLVDRDGVLRYDATGHKPKNNLFTELLPAVSRFVMRDAGAADLAAEPRFAMSVADAYNAIPHKRTTFDASRANMSDAERDYLARLFRITDRAVIERVQTQLWLSSGGASGGHFRNHPLLLAELSALDVPDGLHPVHQLISEAIAEQYRYFQRWERRDGSGFDVNDALVQSSHRKLIQAYKVLKSRFKREDANNDQSFFDHLCALDFI